MLHCWRQQRFICGCSGRLTLSEHLIPRPRSTSLYFQSENNSRGFSEELMQMEFSTVSGQPFFIFKACCSSNAMFFFFCPAPECCNGVFVVCLSEQEGGKKEEGEKSRVYKISNKKEIHYGRSASKGRKKQNSA